MPSRFWDASRDKETRSTKGMAGRANEVNVTKREREFSAGELVAHCAMLSRGPKRLTRLEALGVQRSDSALPIMACLLGAPEARQGPSPDE